METNDEFIVNRYKSFENVLQKNRTVAYVCIGLSFIVMIIFGILSYHLSTNNLIVLDKDGDITTAIKSNELDYFEIESDNHVRLFYDRFFTYNRDTYKDQINLGLALTGPSAKRLYQTFKDAGWYSSVINEDLVLESYVSEPIQFELVDGKRDVVRFYAKGYQIVSKGDLISKRHLDIKGVIRKAERVKRQNPHGLKIDNIVILNNKEVVTNEG